MKNKFVISFFVLLALPVIVWAQQDTTVNPCPEGTVLVTDKTTMVAGDTLWGKANRFAYWYDCGELQSGWVDKEILTTQTWLVDSIVCLRVDSFEVERVDTLEIEKEVEVQVVEYRDPKDTAWVLPDYYPGLTFQANSPLSYYVSVGGYAELFTAKVGDDRHLQQPISYYAGGELRVGIAPKPATVSCDTCWYWGRQNDYQFNLQGGIFLGVSGWKQYQDNQFSPFLQLTATLLDVREKRPEAEKEKGALNLHNLYLQPGVVYRNQNLNWGPIKALEVVGAPLLDLLKKLHLGGSLTFRALVDFSGED